MSWITEISGWINSLQKYSTPIFGPPKDPHTWVAHALVTMAFGILGGTLFWLLGLLVPPVGPWFRLGYALGSSLTAVYYWRREIKQIQARGFKGLDTIMDITTPTLVALLAIWWLWGF